MAFWLIKSDPEAYSWDDLIKEKIASWDGVRNYQARNYLAQMKKGDLLLFYHSQKTTEIVGLATVTKESFPDPTQNDPRWLSVEIKPVKKLKSAVTLNDIKNDKALENIALLKQSRLSVSPVTDREFKIILEKSGTQL